MELGILGACKWLVALGGIFMWLVDPKLKLLVTTPQLTAPL